MAISSLARQRLVYILRDPSNCGGLYPPIEMSAFVFNDIKPGDKVQMWFDVEDVVGDKIYLVGGVTAGRESIVGHQPKEKSLDEEWAGLTDHEKKMLIQKHYESMGR